MYGIDIYLHQSLPHSLHYPLELMCWQSHWLHNCTCDIDHLINKTCVSVPPSMIHIPYAYRLLQYEHTMEIPHPTGNQQYPHHWRIPNAASCTNNSCSMSRVVLINTM